MNKWFAYLIGFFFLIFAIWLLTISNVFFQGLLNRLDNIDYDLQLGTKIITDNTSIHSPIAIVDIDPKSIKTEGHWPWPRSKLTALIEQLRKQGAAVIAFDMIFPEKEYNSATLLLNTLIKENYHNKHIFPILKKLIPEFDGDIKFAHSLQQMPVVLGIIFVKKNFIIGQMPNPLFTLSASEKKQLKLLKANGVINNISILQDAAKHAGIINSYVDPDGILRRIPLIMEYQNNVYPSLAFAAVQYYLGTQANLAFSIRQHIKKLEGIYLDNHFIPTSEQGQVYIPFRGKGFTFPYYSATDVLAGHVDNKAISGKIIFIGTSVTGLGNLHNTSLQSAIPDLEIQATVADGLLTNNFVHVPDWSLEVAITLTLLIGLTLIFIYPSLSPRSIILLMIIIPLLLIYADNIFWKKTGLVLFNLIPISLSLALAIFNLLYGYLFEARKREHLSNMFGQYVPAKHIEAMLREKKNYGLYAENRDMTVLFADIRNFTTISEKMSASDLKNMLNAFFTPLTEIIFHHNGTIDKYIGDLLMAFWGAPLVDKNHMTNALHAAYEMDKALAKINRDLAKQGWPEIKIGIGLNAGIMSVGDMGSQFRRSYTVLGDAVNLASRMESLTKFYGLRILVTDKFIHEEGFIFREIDRVTVHGKHDIVNIYQLIGKKNDMTPAMLKELAESNRALNYYFQQQWNEAEKIYQALAQQNPQSQLYRIFLNRIAEFRLHPPESSWSGIYHYTTKWPGTK